MTSPRRGPAASILLVTLTSSFVSLASLASGCGPDQDPASELALLDAINRVRDYKGDTNGRRMKLMTVRQLPATTPAASAAQDACVRAYDALCNAEDAIWFAELHMSQQQKLGQLSASVVAEVAAAESLLGKAKADMPACEQAAGRLGIVAR